MTEKTMERRRRYRQRHRRNTIATWVAGAVCAAMLVFLAAMGCMDYVNKLPARESSTFRPFRIVSPRSLPGRFTRTARIGTSVLSTAGTPSRRGTT